MKYFIQETIFDETKNKNAGSKARQDINAIAKENGFVPIDVQYDFSLRKEKGVLRALINLTGVWNKVLKGFGEGDTVLIQFPINHHPLRIASSLKKMRDRGAKVIILIHDIDSLRMRGTTIGMKLKKLKVVLEDKSILNQADVIIAHNNKMIDALTGMGVKGVKLIPLGIFDYLANDQTTVKPRQLDAPVVIAGTLRRVKAEYVYHLPTDMNFNLYGVGYDNPEQDNISYKGSFMPEELLSIMDGSFGVVWDGYSDESCLGPAGEYLKINNPHKTSLYLTAGMPVVVWDQAAISEFVINNGVGITIRSLKELREKIDSVSLEDYKKMVDNTISISKKLRSGYYATKALDEAQLLIQ